MTIVRPDVDEVIEALKANQIDVLIIDPFVSSHRVSENDNNAIEIVAELWAEVAEAANCAVLLVHHTRKGNGEEADIYSGRGASALAADARTVRVFNAMTAKEAAAIAIPDEERWLYFRGNSISNLAAPARVADWYKLETVNLENGPMPEALEVQQFRTGDDVGVARQWFYPQATRPAATSEDVAKVQRIIEDGGGYRNDVRSSAWVGTVFAQVFDKDLSDAPSKDLVRKMIGEWLTKGWLKTEVRRVQGVERVYVVVGPNRPAEADMLVDGSSDVPF